MAKKEPTETPTRNPYEYFEYTQRTGRTPSPEEWEKIRDKELKRGSTDQSDDRSRGGSDNR